MAPKRSKKNFLSFILATETNDQLANDFFSKRTTKALFKFFQANGFTDIKEKPDCRDILRARNMMQKQRVQFPAPGKTPCGPRMGY